MRNAVTIPLVAATLCIATVALLPRFRVCTPPTDPVLVPLGDVPPDACVAYYGPGPCREHGMTVVGSTDAVALWPLPSTSGDRRGFEAPR